MSLRASKIVASLILVISLLCPVLELFDHWDHTEQTGNDTEYTLVVLGLCVGIAFTFTKWLLPHTAFAARLGDKADLADSSPRLDAAESFFDAAITPSPPVLKLRI
jgi:hypothetical protein